MKDTASTARVYGLDILRAAAISLVMYGHAYYMLGMEVSHKWYTLLRPDGVSIFFVLSGFLIGGMLLRIMNSTDLNTRDLVAFWIRRWFRTLPAYFLVLLLTALLLIYNRDPALAFPPPGGLWRYFFFIQNLHTPHPEFFLEAWSLCIEEWFYLIVPLLLFASLRLTRLSPKQVFLFWIIAVIILASAFRMYRAAHYEFPDHRSWDNFLRKQVATRLDSIMYGCLGAYILYYHESVFYRHRGALFYAGLALLFLPNILLVVFDLPELNQSYKMYGLFTAEAIGTLALLPKLNALRTGAGIVHRGITFISVISYSLYLLNFSVIAFHLMPYVYPAVGLSGPIGLPQMLIRFALFWLISIGAAWLLYRFYEKPMTGLRERFARRR